MNQVPLQSSNFIVIIVGILAALAGLLFGYDTGVISGAILFISEQFHLSALTTEIIVGAVLLGALLGSAVSGRIADLLGRRLVLIITAVIFILGTLVTATASSVNYLIMGRCLLGVAIGISSFTAPLYLAEIAPAHIRGLLVSLNQLAITVGICMAYVVDLYFAPQGQWRLMLGAGIIPAVILLSALYFLPESPRWMVLRGLNDQARQVLQKIRQSHDVSAELKEIQSSLHHEAGDWRLLFAKWVRPTLYISLGLSFFQQVTGVNTIIYYAPTILKLAGFHNEAGAIMATLGVGCVNVAFTLLALPLIDRWGRRPLLFLGVSGMFLSLLAMAVAFHYPANLALRWVALGSMVFYIACFAMSLGPILWLVISEIFPLRIRGTGASLATTACWSCNMVVAVTFLSMINTLGTSGTFYVYSILCMLALLFIYYCVPETKGCSLEQIEQNLRQGVSPRFWGSQPNHQQDTRQGVPYRQGYKWEAT